MGISLALLKVAMNEPEYNYCQVLSFQNASHAISKLEWEVTNGSELAKGAKKIKGVGKGIAALIDEYLETGEMTRNTNTKTSSVKHTETSVEYIYNTEDDESDEEDVEVVEPFEHDGKEYLIDAEYTVYDVDTHAPVGEYDKENDVLTIL